MSVSVRTTDHSVVLEDDRGTEENSGQQKMLVNCESFRNFVREVKEGKYDEVTA